MVYYWEAGRGRRKKVDHQKRMCLRANCLWLRAKIITWTEPKQSSFRPEAQSPESQHRSRATSADPVNRWLEGVGACGKRPSGRRSAHTSSPLTWRLLKWQQQQQQQLLWPQSPHPAQLSSTRRARLRVDCVSTGAPPAPAIDRTSPSSFRREERGERICAPRSALLTKLPQPRRWTRSARAARRKEEVARFV